MARAGGPAPAQRTGHQQATTNSTPTVPSGTDTVRPRLADVRTISGHRVRLPEPLLYSRAHSPLAVAVYGLVDLLTPRGRGAQPYAGHRRTIAERLGVSVDGLAKALRQLGTPHQRPGLFGEHPAYLATRRRGYRMTAERSAVPYVPFVEVPAWSLGDAAGSAVTHRAWRVYAATLRKRLADGTCRLSGRDLAGLLGMHRDDVGPLLDELEAAGLVLLARAPGKTTVVFPLARPVPPEDRPALAAELADLVGYRPADEAGTCPGTGTSPAPVQASRPAPVRAHRNMETQLLGHSYEDTGGAPPRSLDPPGLAAAPPEDTSRPVDVQQHHGSGVAAYRAARAALDAKVAARRLAAAGAAA